MYRKTGHAIVRVKDEVGRTVALRLQRQRFRTLAKGVLGLAKARGSFEGVRARTFNFGVI